MNLLILFGPPAVGKMTVGQELSRLTGYKLLHNHMTIDLVTELFEFGSPPFQRLIPAFRRMLVSEAAACGLPGLIFTFVWKFDTDEDRIFLDGLRDVAAEHGGETFYAELRADLDQRLYRVGTENRLRHKPKRDAETMRASLLRGEEYRTASDADFPYHEHHICIDNTSLKAEETAMRIAGAFGFPLLEGART